MIYFSPKLLISGLSGVGLVAGGLAAWRLTKPVTLTGFVPSQEQSSNANQKIKDQCGEDIWKNDNEGKNDDQSNEKGKKYHEYQNCESLIWTSVLKTESNEKSQI